MEEEKIPSCCTENRVEDPSSENYDGDGGGHNNDNEIPMPLSKRPKLSPAVAPTDDDETRTNFLTKKCDTCQQDYTESSYTKKQWNKVYGGWICNACLNQERKQTLDRQRVQIKQEKQNCHDQKMADQKAKANGTFHLQKRCFTCQQSLERIWYSGKQWKQLYRQCKSCITEQQNELNSLTGPERKKVLLQKTKKPSLSATATISKENQKQLCSSCEENKGRDCFSSKQWKFTNDEERMCKDCWTEEELAKEQHRYEEQQHKEKHPKGKPKQKRCFACHEFKSLNQSFSGKQSKKAYGICATCVTILQKERRSGGASSRTDPDNDSSTIRKVCFHCHVEKVYEDFGRAQWKSKKGLYRKCRVCALAHVKETDEHRQAEKQARDKERQAPTTTEEETREKDTMTTSFSSETNHNNTFPSKSRRCFNCKQFKLNDNFSLRQVTRTYPICKECSTTSSTSGRGGNNRHAAPMEKEAASVSENLEG